MSKPWTFSSIAPVEATLPIGAKGDVPLGKWRKGLFECFSNCGMCLCVFSARMKYRARDEIPAECCGSGMIADCLSAWCCSPCSVVQMFSQDEITFAGGSGRSYRMFWSPYGEPLKPLEPVVLAEAV